MDVHTYESNGMLTVEIIIPGKDLDNMYPEIIADVGKTLKYNTRVEHDGVVFSMRSHSLNREEIIDRVKAHIQDVRMALSANRGLIAHFRKSINGLGTELKIFKSENTQLRERLKAREEQVMELENAVEKHEAELDMLHRRLAEVEILLKRKPRKEK